MGEQSVPAFLRNANSEKTPANYPHKLTKTAEPWLGGGAASGGSELHARVTSAAVRSCHFVLVAAAAAPLFGGRDGGRSLQLRVSALAGLRELRENTAPSNSICRECHIRLDRTKPVWPGRRRPAHHQAIIPTRETG